MPEGLKSVYSSCACNDSPHSLDWGRNGLVVYGARHAVAVYDPEYDGAGKVVATLHHHKDDVQSVRWVKDDYGTPETEFISTSGDRTAVIWSHLHDVNYYPSAVLEGHTDVVLTADGLYTSGKSSAGQRSMIVATGSADCSVIIWKRKENTEKFSILKTLSFAPHTCVCTRLHFLPNSKEVLLACGIDRKVQLFAGGCSDFVEVECLVNHRDYVWTVDITTTESGDLWLATGSQDCEVHIWKISACKEPNSQERIDETHLVDKSEKRVFCIAGCYYALTSLDVLVGYEDAVYGVSWHPGVYSENGEKLQQPAKLVSSAMDRIAIIWTSEEPFIAWRREDCLQEDSVITSEVGFYGCCFGPDGLAVLIHGFEGTFHIWRYHENEQEWVPGITIGGHFQEVLDVQWEPCGDFLLSVSKDRTARVHAPWNQSENQECATWHEISRSQVHGFDLSCLTMLSCHTYASGGEEKVIRVFQAPKNFRGNLARICKLESKIGDDEDKSVPLGAITEEMGLSNIPIREGETMPVRNHAHRKRRCGVLLHLEFKEPPTEEFLFEDTLWPEIHKLYGHGYEVYTLASHPNGKFFASACKAANPKHAGIVLWNTETWDIQQVLMSHTLTVTQMAFSPDGQYLLSVSRDRRWSLFKLTGSDHGEPYQLVASTNKENAVHTRIVRTCSWSHDSQYFVTGSRDGKAVIWKSSSDQPHCLSLFEFENAPVSAVAFAPSLVSDSYVIAVGFESGVILIYAWHADSKLWKRLLLLDNNMAHHLTVKRLTFKPNNAAVLASCGSDNFVKIYDLSLAYKMTYTCEDALH